MIDSLRADNSIVESNFSKHADLYDKYAGIQCLAAEKLINISPSRDILSILDVGCGTGNYTLLLREKFKFAQIKAIDISRDMINVARRKFDKGGIEFIVADAEELGLACKFDLITSNATFQWFNDLDLCLIKYKNSLTEEGSILFSTLGPLTFCELGAAVKETLGSDMRISSDRFLGKEELTGMMKDNFSEIRVDETVIKKKYGSLEELLQHIKYTGARGSRLSGNPVWTRNMLSKVEEAYMAKSGCIEASYHIFYCGGSR